MKKTYIEPKTTIVLMELQTMIAATLEGERNVSQEDFNNDGNPSVVGERTGTDDDPTDDHTVGGGSINRSKSGMIWDEW